MSFRLAYCLFLLLIFSGCTKDTPQVIHNPKEVDLNQVFDSGHVENGEFIHQYLKFKFSIPDELHLADKEAIEKAANLGKSQVKRDLAPDVAQKITRAIDVTSSQLTAISIFPFGEPKYNSNLMCIAERLPDAGGRQSSREYLTAVKKGLQAVQPDWSYGDIIKSNQIQNSDFSLMKIRFISYGVDTQHNYYVTTKKGFGIMFVITSNSDENTASLERCIYSFKNVD